MLNYKYLNTHIAWSQGTRDPIRETQNEKKMYMHTRTHTYFNVLV